MKRPFVTIVLAGGKGTRMGSSDKHKVCFEVLGVPVIVRALDTYNLCGSQCNIVVVGMMAEKVMATVNQRLPGTLYAFQEQPLGTGHAARKGADILERMRFEGDVLVVAGDKLIEPHVIRRLVARHQQSGAAVTLATATRPANSNAGILLRSPRGNIIGILEEPERQRLLGLARLSEAFEEQERVDRLEPALQTLPRATVEQLVAQVCGEKASRNLMGELWSENGESDFLSRTQWERRFSPAERGGLVRVGKATVPASEVLSRCDQMNLSTYIFHAPVLYEALHLLKASRSSREEYLTDVFEILANRRPPTRVVGMEIRDRRDLMAFNDPHELLAMEEAYRQKHGVAASEVQPGAAGRLATAQVWLDYLQGASPAAQRQFRQWYGDGVPWEPIRTVVTAFLRRYGNDRPALVVRSPGRINLMGRHIDHQGGTVNVMAINREIFVVASPRTDDRVTLANTNESRFAEREFRISDLVAHLDWDDWQRVIDSPRLQRVLEAARGDWGNYIQAVILRLQEQFRDRQLRGLDMMVGGDIPMGAGLSSSSALVVATAEAVALFNHLPVSARRLVSLCGEGEWFVGTRGGAADHAAIKLSRRGYVTRVDFFPFQIGDSAKFFPDCDLIVCNSGVYAGKSQQARNTFNEKVTAYHLGRIWCKSLRPDLAAKIQHLRDVNPKTLGLSRTAFAELLSRLPKRLTRAQVQSTLPQLADADRDRIQRLFHSHEAPAQGYPVRDVVLFGLSEMARARRCLGLLKQGDARRLGRLMTLSHDGDRVSRQNTHGAWRRMELSVPDSHLLDWSRRSGQDGDLGKLSGAYGCSLPAIDRIVDIACQLPGVEGAQLAGAGLGGCVMALAQKTHTASVLKALEDHGIQAEVFRPIAGACSLTLYTAS